MEILNSFFTFRKIFQIGGIVFSFLFIVLTIQMFASISQVAKSVLTRGNSLFIFVSLFLIIISVILFILGFVIL